jgi:bacterial SH3 domain protein
MKKALSVISVGFLSLSLLAACNGGESETQKELAALKEQLAQQQKQQAERENQEQEHRKQIEQQQREDELYQKAYQDAQEDLQMQQMLEEEKKQEEAKKKQAAEERKREEAKKKQALEEEPKQKEEVRIKQEEPKIRQEESPKATAKPAASQQASKVTEKLVRYPAFVISESGSGSLNLRGGPSISAVSVTQLKDGQQLQVVAETNACTNANGGCWVKVQVGGLTGYVSNAYLQKGHVRDGAYAY